MIEDLTKPERFTESAQARERRKFGAPKFRLRTRKRRPVLRLRKRKTPA